MTLREYVDARGYGRDFLDLYIVPMGGAVWSTPPEKMLEFPAVTLMRFWHNHGFLGLNTQHPWWTVVERRAVLRAKAHRPVPRPHPARRLRSRRSSAGPAG